MVYNLNGVVISMDDNIAPQFSESTAYAAGDYVLKLQTNGQNVLYKFTAAHAAGAWTGTDAQAVTMASELANKANVDGAYEGLTAGNAEQLVSTQGVEDKEPYMLRTTGGSADVGNRVDVRAIVGGTVVLNQLAESTTGSQTISGITITNNSDGSITLNGTATAAVTYNTGVRKPKTPNDKILIMGCPVGGAANTYYLKDGYGSARDYGDGAIGASTLDYTIAQIRVASGVTLTNVVFWPEIFDLTKMFGPAVADYVYSLNNTSPGSGVAWLRQFFPQIFDAGYIPYNAGELRSVEGLVSMDNTGFNLFNPATGAAKLIEGRAYQITGGYTSLSYSTGETITPDTDGQFTPTDSGTLTVTGGNATDTCVHLVWSGTRNGEHEPYVLHSYPLDSSLTLRGILKVDASGNPYWDGDRYLPDGTVVVYFAERAHQAGDEDLTDAITDGTTTVYKLDEPVTATADPYQQTQICDDWGTQEFVVADSAGLIPSPGTESFFQANLRDKLQHLPDLADDDGYYLIQQSGTQMQLVAFRIPQAPTTDGTYVLKATVSGGTPTYTWVEEAASAQEVSV